jgi:predicted DNA-binding transcriptional regulator YafY
MSGFFKSDTVFGFTKTVSSSRHPVAQKLIDAANEGRSVCVQYARPGEPRTERTIRPRRLLNRMGSPILYMDAYCEMRLEDRIFEVSWIEIVDS